jgi:hypothetical protein
MDDQGPGDSDRTHIRRKLRDPFRNGSDPAIFLPAFFGQILHLRVG